MSFRNQSYEPYTSHEFFTSQAKIIIMNESQYKYEYRQSKLLNPNETVIIFIKSPLLYIYFNLLNTLPCPYILITSCNLDVCMPYLYYPCRNRTIYNQTDILLQSSKLIKWYTKNPSIVHDKIKPIPIGIKWQMNSQLFFGEDNSKVLTFYKSIAPNVSTVENNFKTNKTNLVYFNFNTATTVNCFYTPYNSLRDKIKSTLLKNDIKYNQDQPFNEYIKTLSTYKFAVSPPGKGIDSHRTWEALFSGCIPIVLSSPLNSLYKDLPVLILENYSSLSEEYLNFIYQSISSKEYDFNILFSKYWKDQLTL
jgi:hypothetical protein